MLQKYRKYNVLNRKEKLLFLEALFIHLYTGLLLKVIPFRWIPRVFSSRQFKTPTNEEDQSRHNVSGRQSDEVELIKTAIVRASWVSPWRNKCLVSSLAGRCMLRRRRISSVLFLGMAKGIPSRPLAHAWLTSAGNEIVAEGGNYTVLYTF